MMIKLYKNKGGIKLLLVVGALALIIIFLLIYRLKETKKNNTISEELEKEIRKVKQMIADYQRIKNLIRPSKEDYERQINILLDRLNNLLKMKK